LSDTTSPVSLIYKELFERYEELKQLAEGLNSRPRVVVVGQVASAPDQLYRALFGAAEAATDCAPSEEEPGAGWHVAATFKLEDVPGRGVIGGDGPQEQALSYLREADAVLLTLLADRRPTEVEVGLWDHLKRLDKPRAAVVASPLPLDAADQPRAVPELDDGAWSAWVTELRRLLNERDALCLPCRFLHGADLVEIALHLHDEMVCEASHRLVLVSMLAHQASRERLVSELITQLANTAAWLGLTPIPFSDVAAITPVQVLLVCRVAAAYGHRLTPAQAREFIAAIGTVAAAGMGFRGLFRWLTRSLGEGLLPVKLAIGAAMAWSGTQIVGRAARLHFRRAGHLGPAEAGRRARAELQQEVTTGWQAPWRR
jgi:uncharacterized protein (DUF697 family)